MTTQHLGRKLNATTAPLGNRVAHVFTTAHCGLFVVIAAFWTSPLAYGQLFQNLDFEASVFEVDTGGTHFVRAPGWRFSGEYGDGVGDRIELGLHIGNLSYQRMLTDLPTRPFPLPPPPPTQGHFSVLMGGPPYGPAPSAVPWMEQTGLIPPTARYFRLPGNQDPFGLRATDPTKSSWRLSVDGAEIPMSRADGLVSADISAYAGTVRTLRIAIDGTYETPPIFGDRIKVIFDSMEFVLVPEPTTGSLGITLSAVAWLVRITRRLPARAAE
jgi:hypothetical protein